MQEATNNNRTDRADKPRNAICWALRYSNAMEFGVALDDRWKKKGIDARICVECAFAVSEKSLAQLSQRRVMPSACPLVKKKKKKGTGTEFSSSAGLWFCLSDTEREVMAHFVKLIGSLERHGSKLVPLNFSSDYTKELTR